MCFCLRGERGERRVFFDENEHFSTFSCVFLRMIDVSDIAWKDLSVSICHPSRIQETPFVAFVCCSKLRHAV